MKKLRINGWSEWQSYRKDRGAPPWIKVHRCLMSCEKWATLSDSEKGQLISIWIIAADNNGEVPANPKTLKKICQLDEEPNIENLVSLGLLAECQPSDRALASSCQPSDAPEERREEEIRTKQNRTDNNAYAFCGDVIKISQKDFAKWQEVYDLIPDLKSFLYAKDLYYASLTEKERKGWFMRVSTLLGKEQAKYAAEAKAERVEEEREANFKRRQEEYRASLTQEDWDRAEAEFMKGLE